ncbi:MAG: hypothetical protein IGS03_02430 [Candidatus Sericytochromatia bacterium]|nr:hypothetical protein [Candidatus Sericytochromatia bacterium]
MSYEAIIREMQNQLQVREEAYTEKCRRQHAELMDLAEEAEMMLDRRRNRKARAAAQLSV